VCRARKPRGAGRAKPELTGERLLFNEDDAILRAELLARKVSLTYK